MMLRHDASACSSPASPPASAWKPRARWARQAATKARPTSSPPWRATIAWAPQARVVVRLSEPLFAGAQSQPWPDDPWGQFFVAGDQLREEALTTKGAGLSILTENTTSPTFAVLVSTTR